MAWAPRRVQRSESGYGGSSFRVRFAEPSTSPSCWDLFNFRCPESGRSPLIDLLVNCSTSRLGLHRNDWNACIVRASLRFSVENEPTWRSAARVDLGRRGRDAGLGRAYREARDVAVPSDLRGPAALRAPGIAVPQLRGGRVPNANKPVFGPMPHLGAAPEQTLDAAARPTLLVGWAAANSPSFNTEVHLTEENSN